MAIKRIGGVQCYVYRSINDTDESIPIDAPIGKYPPIDDKWVKNRLRSAIEPILKSCMLPEYSQLIRLGEMIELDRVFC